MIVTADLGQRGSVVQAEARRNLFTYIGSQLWSSPQCSADASPTASVPIGRIGSFAEDLGRVPHGRSGPYASHMCWTSTGLTTVGLWDMRFPL